MTRSPAKRSAVSPSEEGEDDVEDRAGAEIKRIKLERGLHAVGEEIQADVEADGDDEENLEEENGEDDDEVEDGEESQRLEFPDDVANIKAFEEARSRQGRFLGTASEAGLIKSVTLIDFMCHRHLKVDFGARMNFLVGHNGSGKSAVLTGIAVALGGKAAVTGRGQGLKDLIRKGCDKAVITVTMSNEGPEAYKPEVYDSNIIIERTLVKSGASCYKFRAERNGKTLASKRDELTQICEWFNVTVDSPLTVLTQDQARSFLQNADNNTMYKFFLEGTQLHTLMNSYTQVNEMLDQISAIIDQQRGQVPELENRVESLRRQIDASRKIVELKKKSRDIHRELAWSYVVRKEQDRDSEQVRMEELDRKLADIIKETGDCQRKWQPATEAVQHMEDEMGSFDATRQPLEQAKGRARKKHDDARKELKAMEESGRDIEKGIKSSENEILSLNKRIAEKQRALDADEDPEQAELRVRYGKVEELQRKLKKEVPQKEDLMRNMLLERDEARDGLADVDRQIEDVGVQISTTQGILRNLEGQSTDRLSAFGANLPKVLEEIRRARWNHSAPIGPLGLYVRLEDMRYKDAFHSLLGQNMCTFAVRHSGDKATMLKILQHCGKVGYRPGTGAPAPPPIIQHTGDMFDYSPGDLSRHGDTVLSKLIIDNEHVLRILINATGIERTFVSPTSVTANAEMTRLLESGLPRCSFITADGFSTAGTSRSRQSGPYQRWGGNMLFTRDLAADIEVTKGDLAWRQSQRAKLLDDRKVASTRENEVDKTLAETRRSSDQVKKGVVNSQAEMDRIQEKLSEQPSNEIDSLEAAKKGSEAEQDGLEEQLRAIGDDRARVLKVIEQLAEEVARRDAELEEFTPERTRRQAALQVLIERRAQIQSNLKHWNSSRATTEAQHNEAKAAFELLQADLVDWTKKAQEYWHERIDTERTSKEIERERMAISKAVADAEKRQDVRAEDIMPAFMGAEAKLKELQHSIVNLERLHQTLMAALKARRKWWSESRGHIAVKARCLFILNLQKRHFEGRLDFDHIAETLAVRIRTTGTHSEETQDEPSQARFKAPRNLSGGERSFSTVSLLLALWDTVSCPIRCLDEWDVFLDPVNRALAAKMLVEGARESDGKQFILITPQDMAGVQTGGPDNRVIRLSDPTRNQGTIEFPSA